MTAHLGCSRPPGGACAGGWLYQQADSLTPASITFTPVSETQPSEQQLADLRFAWLAVKHVKSNAIAVAKDGRLLGMGSGQPNRVKSTQIALEKAGDDAKVGCVQVAKMSPAASVGGMPFSGSAALQQLISLANCLAFEGHCR